MISEDIDKVNSNLDVFVPVGLLEGTNNIKPLAFNGSGDIRATIGSLGFVRIEKGSILKKGDFAEVWEW